VLARKGVGRHARTSIGAGFALLLSVALALACSHPVQRRDWSGYQGPGAVHFHEEEIDPPYVPDPLEPANRSVSAVNHVLIEGLASPAGRLYRLVVPRYARDRLRDFSANLLWPRNLVANLLQARFPEAGSETLRFGINSTVGLAGLWDPAMRWFRIEPRPEDFGQVFATWGWRPSTFVMLPLYGPSTPRDAVGLVPDTLLDPTTYFSPYGYALTVNDLVDSIDPYQRFVATSFDAYDDARVVWSLLRDARIDDDRPSLKDGGEPDAASVQTLESVFLAPRDPHFWDFLETGRAPIPGTGRALPYSYRLQKGRAPAVFLMPGLGTHRLGASSLALAEMAWRRGFSVVIVSNAFCFEFMLRAATTPVPGHAPVDARDVRDALAAVLEDVQVRHPNRFGRVAFMGYSLGAFHGFFLAARAKDPDALPFARYVLLDPPVRLAYGLDQLDDFYNAPLELPPERRAAEVRRIQRKALHFAEVTFADEASSGATRLGASGAGGSSLEPSRELPFDRMEARYLIGLSFRRSLQATLWISQQREDLGVLRTPRSRLRRTSAYEEISDYSWSEYLYAFVLPYYRDRRHLIESAEDLERQNDLRALAGALRGNPSLRVFANANDFITSDEDVAWLMRVIGRERVSLFPTGGHLGNLHRPAVQDMIMDSLADLR
jgi:phospholipid-binding lipoprotein MlaA